MVGTMVSIIRLARNINVVNEVLVSVLFAFGSIAISPSNT